jgi:hypothetical protein
MDRQEFAMQSKRATGGHLTFDVAMSLWQQTLALPKIEAGRAWALCQGAREAVPDLLEILDELPGGSLPHETNGAAAKALRKIDPMAAAKIGLL